ncbi:MAG: alpha/beta-type small acid-soluble spore protein [Bacillota bacterium]|nr:alpha/beta-type small acid-soluble spore protein [Bacillota bacterium]MDI7250453.1 alpha/beta-type small acid-soluble spore protein [Bacillota bacterium]
MPKFMNQPKVLPDHVLDNFKYELADELGITPKIRDGYWGDVPARECGKVGGKIGGNIVKVMIRHAEQALEQNQGQGRSNL